MQVSTHDRDTPAANKQHKIEDQLPEYFNHGISIKWEVTDWELLAPALFPM